MLTKGVYVLTDNSFKWFTRMSTAAGAQDAINKAQPVYLLLHVITKVSMVSMRTNSWRAL